MIENFPALKREAEGAQHIYSIFSKYEHNVAFSFDLLHNPYSFDGGTMVKKMIKNGVDSCIYGLKTICINWIGNDDSLATILNKVASEIIHL